METNVDLQLEAKALFELVPELPPRILKTYARLWQFETWLRHMVYVELRAKKGDDWASSIKKADFHKNADKQLTHMPTPEEGHLSYIQFSELLSLVKDNWELFESYLLPKSIWDARIEEVKQIRHRVAHFRTGHQDDLRRIIQLLRDVDRGFWRFCTSYNDSYPVLPQENDPVTKAFLHLDQFPWTRVGEKEGKGSWARIGFADPQAAFDLTIELIKRPWANWSESPKEGFLYNVCFMARGGRVLDYKSFLEITQNVHKHVAHICLDHGFKLIRVTLPSVLGEELIVKTIGRMVDSIPSCLIESLYYANYENTGQELADRWPEYVLGPSNPLTFLCSDMECSFFSAAMDE